MSEICCCGHSRMQHRDDFTKPCAAICNCMQFVKEPSLSEIQADEDKIESNKITSRNLLDSMVLVTTSGYGNSEMEKYGLSFKDLEDFSCFIHENIYKDDVIDSVTLSLGVMVGIVAAKEAAKKED